MSWWYRLGAGAVARRVASNPIYRCRVGASNGRAAVSNAPEQGQRTGRSSARGGQAAPRYVERVRYV